MAFTVRGYTLAVAADLPGTIAVPAGTVAGDGLLLLYHTDAVTGQVYPDDAVAYPAGLYVAAGVWQLLGTTAVSNGADFDGTAICYRIATAGDVSTGIVTTNGATFAVLIAYTGDAPAAPRMAASGNLIDGDPLTRELIFDGQPNLLVFATAVLDWVDSGATLDQGTSLVSTADAHTILVSYSTVDALTTQTVSLTTTDGFSVSPHRDADFAVIVIPTIATGPDNFADAIVVDLAVDGDTYVSGAIDNRSLTVETGEPLHHDVDSDTDVGVRSAWWSYTPQADGTLTVDTDLSPSEAYTQLFACTGTTVDALTVATYADGEPLSMAVTAATTYYLKVGSWDDTSDSDQMFTVRISGPTTVGGAITTVPTIQGDADLSAPADPFGSNDFFATPRGTLIAVNGDTFVSDSVSNADYDVEIGEPGRGARTAWWIYRPVDSGPMHADTSLCEGAMVGSLNLGLYHGTVLEELEEIQFDDAAVRLPAVAQVDAVVVAGETYYLRIGADRFVDDASTLILAVTGPRTINADVIPTIDVGVAFRPDRLVRMLESVAVTADAMIAVPDLTQVAIVLLDPVAGCIVPTRHVVFRVQFSVTTGDIDTVDIEVQYDTTNTFPSSTTLTATDDTVTGVVTFDLPTTVDLTPGGYFWRARATYGGLTSPWRAASAFTVTDPAGVQFDTPITWTVATGSPSPHLWFALPAVGSPGDSIVLIGHGFGTSLGSVHLAGVTASVLSWSHVTGTGATTARAIDALSGTADPDHERVVFTVPDIPGPGGELTVEV